ncbi:Hypothetical predicted protein [Cloeon dipterum]|uniref:Methyltransferase FkbM domain-containing protein n=1 Tax=Cloeon dipterum TaxID=197152 RepID=A0A8S1E4W9_9INSE|nr:Hypothetical predicted protein [Cloeon dipterum]
MGTMNRRMALFTLKVLKKHGDLIFITICAIFLLKYVWRNESDGPDAPISPEEMEKMDRLFDTDEELIQFTKSRVLIRPSSRSVPYNLEKESEKDNSKNQVASTIHTVLGRLKNGFFVECGVWDGERDSNTLMLEKRYNWTGLLVEGSPTESKIIKTKNRKAWLAPVCMSTSTSSMIVSFMDNSYAGRIIGPQGMNLPGMSHVSFVSQLCIPFNTLMAALNQTTIDYFSLDVEGHELEILSTIDFERFFIRTMTVEYTQSADRLDEILELMDENGFKLHSKNSLDFIFVNKKNKNTPP